MLVGCSDVTPGSLSKEHEPGKSSGGKMCDVCSGKFSTGMQSSAHDSTLSFSENRPTIETDTAVAVVVLCGTTDFAPR